MGQVAKHGLVEQFIPLPSVEAFHEAIVHRLARRDIVPFTPFLGTPPQDGVLSQVCPIVRDNHPRLSASLDPSRQPARHPTSRDLGVRDRRHALTRDVVGHVEHRQLFVAVEPIDPVDP